MFRAQPPLHVPSLHVKRVRAPVPPPAHAFVETAVAIPRFAVLKFVAPVLAHGGEWYRQDVGLFTVETGIAGQHGKDVGVGFECQHDGPVAPTASAMGSAESPVCAPMSIATSPGRRNCRYRSTSFLARSDAVGGLVLPLCDLDLSVTLQGMGFQRPPMFPWSRLDADQIEYFLELHGVRVIRWVASSFQITPAALAPQPVAHLRPVHRRMRRCGRRPATAAPGTRARRAGSQPGSRGQRHARHRRRTGRR